MKTFCRTFDIKFSLSAPSSRSALSAASVNAVSRVFATIGTESRTIKSQIRVRKNQKVYLEKSCDILKVRSQNCLN